MQEIASGLDNQVDYLFCGTSTCGTIRGCGEYIRDRGLATKIIAVDAEGSCIFGPRTGNGQQVDSLLKDREADITEAVGRAYTLHAQGESSLPHSLRLGFPGSPAARIMALPGVTVPTSAPCVAC